MLPFQISRCLSHFLQIQRKRDEISISSPHRIGKFLIQHPVFIGLFCIAVSWMPVCRHLAGINYYDIFREQRIHSIKKPFRWNGRFCIKYSHISSRVNSCIRPARPDHLHCLSGQLRQCRIQFSFYRRPVILYLPAAVICSVIGNCQSDSSHSFPVLFFYYLYLKDPYLKWNISSCTYDRH